MSTIKASFKIEESSHTNYLGIKITELQTGALLSRSGFIKRFVEEFGMEECKDHFATGQVFESRSPQIKLTALLLLAPR